MRFASWKERKTLAAALKPIYRATDAEAALAELDAFAAGPWGLKYPAIVASWRRHWEAIIPFFSFSADLRKMISTTNAIESLNHRARQAVRNRGHFPNDVAATKAIYLVLKQVEAKWTHPPPSWHAARSQLAIQFEGRFIMTDS